MELAEKHDLLILSDEVYKDFLFTREEFTTLAQFPAFRKRLIYIFSFSKAYAMTGWRIAFLAADKSLTEKIIGIHDALVTCAPVVSQWAALGALELAQEDKATFREAFSRRRKLICQEFEPLQDWLEFVNPQAAYFIFPRATDKLKRSFEKWEKQQDLKEWDLRLQQEQSFSWKLALALLYQAKVALVPGVAFGPQGEDHLRLCFGRSEKDIKLTTKRIKEFLKELEKI
jgi:aminotransferase